MTSTPSTTQEFGDLRDRLVSLETKVDLVLDRLTMATEDHEVRIRMLEGRPATADHESRLRELEGRTATWKGAIVAVTSGLSALMAVLALVLEVVSR